MYTEDDDDIKLNDYSDYDEGDDNSDDSGEDEGDSSSDFGIPKKSGGFKGFSKFVKRAGKVIKTIAKVFSLLPTSVKIVIITILMGIIAYIIVEVNKEESSETVNTSVDTTIEKMEDKLNNPDLTNEEKEKIKKAIDHFEKNNSYLYFTIQDINDAYKVFEEQYQESSNDVASSTYKSLSTKMGSDKVKEDNEISRIVDSNQKVELYKHLLMTEKYNFNKVKWYWYGHGHNGEELTVANNTLQEDKELGIIYPNDGTTKLETFIKLLSPNMQTWHIPLAFHSGFITKSGPEEEASKFTYSVIKNAYSDIVVNRYDIQTYVLNTKYNDYMETKYKSRFSYNIAVTTTYKAREITRKITNLSYQYLGSITFEKVIGTWYVNDQIRNYGSEEEYKNELKSTLIKTGSSFKIVQANGVEENITINGDNCVIWNADTNIMFSSNITPGNEYYAIRNIEILKDTGTLKYTFEKYIINSDTTTEVEYEKDANGNIIYDIYYKYSYSPGQILAPHVVESKYVNEIAVDGQENKENPEVDPMKEEVESSFIDIAKSYYISSAKTFDLEITRDTQYIKYNENDVKNRINPKTRSQTYSSDYYNEVDVRNKLTMSVFGNIANTTVEDLSKIFNTIEGENSFNNTSNLYSVLKTVAPNTEVKDSNTTTSAIVGVPNSKGYIIKTDSYTNTYQNKNEYIIQEGKVDNKQGTHHIKRTWYDTLTNKTPKEETYVVDDLVDFNVKYNSVLKNTKESKEKEKFDKKVENSQLSYSEYETLGDLQKLNNIYFINSNSNIFDDYLVDTNEESEIMGYNTEWLKVGLDELKRMFEETVNEKEKFPYVYGISLGLADLIEESKKSKVSSGGGLFGWPTDNEYISCIYGLTPIYGKDYHDGIDIWSYFNEENHNPEGLFWDTRNNDYTVPAPPVYAIADGEVILADDLGMVSNEVLSGGYGNRIVIKHNNGYISSYNHLYTGTFEVKVGDKVKRGQQLANMGSSGSSSCNHLHFCIYDNSSGKDIYNSSNRLDPLEFYRVEPSEINTIAYGELLEDTSLRKKIDKFNMYKYAGTLGSGEITDGSLPDLTDDEKDELVSELEGTDIYNWFRDNPDWGNLDNLWLWQYYQDNPVELIARVMYSEFTSSKVEDESLVYMLAAHAHSILNYAGTPENVYSALTNSLYAATMGSNRFVSPDVPREYRQIAAAAIDGTLPYPPGYIGDEVYWIGSSDWIDGTNSNHPSYHKADETCAYRTDVGFHAFLSINNNGKYGLLVPSDKDFAKNGKPRPTLNEKMKIADGVYVNKAAGGSTERNYKEILEVISRY